MIIDAWRGLEVYRSKDLLQWDKQAARLLEEGGSGQDDGAMGGHPDVVIRGDRAYLFYFTHPGRTRLHPARPSSYEAKRSVIQVTELKLNNGQISCNRDEPTYIQLKNKKS